MLETPGHTSGHIAFWFEKGKALFPVSLLSFLFFPVSCFSFRGVLVSRRSTTTLLQNASPKKKLF